MTALEPPPATSAEPRRADRGVTWLRRRIDGAPGYQLSIDVLRGRMTGGDGEAITLHPDARGEIELRVTALTGEPPLTPLPADELVDEGARAGRAPAADPRLPELSREAARGLLAIRHLLRPRHADVARAARAGG